MTRESEDDVPATRSVIRRSYMSRVGVLLLLVALLLAVALIWLLWRADRQGLSFTPSTTAEHAQLLFLAWDEHDRNQLHLADPADGSVQQLTQTADGVIDYRPSPTGAAIVYSAQRDDGAADLHLLDMTGAFRSELLLSCDLAICSGPVWTPDGSRLLYERRDLIGTDTQPAPPRLWWLDPANGETVPLFESSERFGLAARFSAGGNWLSYLVPGSQEIHAYNLETGKSVLIASETGEPGAWSPAGQDLLITDMEIQGEGFSVHIFHVDPETGVMNNLSREVAINDGSVSYSPDGAWILFGRKVARAPMGKQLWLMRPDGSEATALTTEPEIHNGLPSWSPDGSRIAIQRYAIDEPGAEPGIWILDLDSGELHEIYAPGIQPQWLP